MTFLLATPSPARAQTPPRAAGLAVRVIADWMTKPTMDYGEWRLKFGCLQMLFKAIDQHPQPLLIGEHEKKNMGRKKCSLLATIPLIFPNTNVLMVKRPSIFRMKYMR